MLMDFSFFLTMFAAIAIGFFLTMVGAIAIGFFLIKIAATAIDFFHTTVAATTIGFFITMVAATTIGLFITTLAAISIGFFTLFRKLRIYEENKNVGGSSSTSTPFASSSSTSPPSALLSSTSPPSSLSSSTPSTSPPSSSTSPPSSSTSPPSSYGTHHVFPSFRGEDIRRNLLSHIQKEFKKRGIVPFIDNEIKRGESIGPELIKAIRRSKIAIVLLSRNYASSKWCLDELVEIMNCKKKFGLTVFAIFYEVDPSHVKKLTGDFGSVFEETCKGGTMEDIRRWRQAFKEVATIAGYDSRSSKWENDADMIEEIVTEIAKRLISYAPSGDLEGLIGMATHMEKLKQLLCLGSTNERRTVGITGPSGIGKSTIARVLHNQISHDFDLSVFMKFKPSDAKPTCSDDHHVRLQLEQEFLSQLIKQTNIKICRLGTSQTFLIKKKVLIVLDGVDRLVQLRAIPKLVCLSPGSRIIITTQDQKLLKAFNINHIYNVDFPPDNEAFQMFCKYAFDRDSPYDGFEDLSWEVIKLAGKLPLGIRVMGSYLLGMSKQEWEADLSRLRASLDGEILNALKFSYDALIDEDKEIFLCIACFFNDEGIDHTFEDTLCHKFSNVRRGLEVLLQRFLISKERFFRMHDLLVQLGREIVRNQSINEPGKRQFLVDAKEIRDVLTDHTGSKNVIGINWNFSSTEDEIILSERVFEGMSNLQFLRIDTKGDNKLRLPQGLKYLPPKLRILHWDYFPMTYMPSKFNPKFLIKIILRYSKLKKLWEGMQPVFNLKVMDLRYAKKLKELPDLSTASNLLEINLLQCSRLIELPSSIEKLINLRKLNLNGCSNLVKLPSSIGNTIDLQELFLSGCSSLNEVPSSIRNMINFQELYINRCSSLAELLSSIENIINVQKLDLSEYSILVKIPSSINDLSDLYKLDLSGCSSITELKNNVWKMDFSGCSRLVNFPSSIQNIVNLQELILTGCSSLYELPSSLENFGSLQKIVLW